MMEYTVENGCDVLVNTCAVLRPNESALIISDHDTRSHGDFLEKACAKVTKRVKHLTIKPLTMHGSEPEPKVREEMLTADVIFGLTKMSMAHSQARLMATQRGARYLSLPDYSEAVFTRPALYADFHKISRIADLLRSCMSNAEAIKVTSKSGTEITCVARGRVANSAPGWCDGAGTLASPPDAEVNVAVLENESNGRIVVDGSIPHPRLGILEQPIELEVRSGRVVGITGGRAQVLESIFNEVGDPAARTVAEFGIGLNPRAELCGLMLEDEGTLGTVHFGIGSNKTVGGNSSVPFHLDHVVKHASITVNDQSIMENGKFVPKYA